MARVGCAREKLSPAARPSSACGCLKGLLLRRAFLRPVRFEFLPVAEPFGAPGTPEPNGLPEGLSRLGSGGSGSSAQRVRGTGSGCVAGLAGKLLLR